MNLNVQEVSNLVTRLNPRIKLKFDVLVELRIVHIFMEKLSIGIICCYFQ